MIKTATGSLGTYLTGASGRALYAWKADSNGKSNCMGACAKAWPPLTASAMPHVAGSVKTSDLTLISRSGGTKQVAYMGHPLYYFVGDTGAGSTKGEGSMGFGAVWDLVSPSGNPIAKHSSSGGSSSGSSSGSSWG
jgi:predicted lipoprotein with Yx(FWY)xxD motif